MAATGNKRSNLMERRDIGFSPKADYWERSAVVSLAVDAPCNLPGENFTA